jgi:hypothetical protein
MTDQHVPGEKGDLVREKCPVTYARGLDKCSGFS